jgi:fructan beta-fructosidase
MNDPNGLILHEGEYNLFYQHNPDADTWGPMHWGHAVSADLLRWEHLPIALEPDHLGTIFSGSAVIDEVGSSGFGAGALIAVFTHDGPDGQSQALAASVDAGRTWRKYAGNPVLRAPDGLLEFRDPRVFRWNRGPNGGHWVMALACGREIRVYTSPALVHWTFASVHGGGDGTGEGLWETPDLFELPVDGGPEVRWVLSYGVLDGGPCGGSGTRYVVGSFDGSAFTPDGEAQARWADLGPDFYAAQTWSGSSPRRTWVAWLNNWAYARDLPSAGWRGTMTVPRDLALVRTSAGIRLRQVPTAALAACRVPLAAWQDDVLRAGACRRVGDGLRSFDVTVSLGHSASPAARLRLRVPGAEGLAAEVNIDPAAGILVVQRPPVASGDGEAWTRPVPIPLRAGDGTMTARILVDGTSLEVFADDGLATASFVLPPSSRGAGITVEAVGGDVALSRLTVDEIRVG